MRASSRTRLLSRICWTCSCCRSTGGKGYSRRLVEAVLAHPGLQGLRRILLHTSNAHGLYEKFGFAPPAKPQTCLEIAVADTYRR